MKSVKRIIAAAAITACAGTLAGVAPAHAAVTKLSSTVKYCRNFQHDGSGGRLSYSDHYAYCAQVYTTTNLIVRSGPSTSTSRVWTLPAGRVTEFDCWTNGQYVNGNRTWLKLYSAWGTQYVSDRYVYSGPNVRTILPQC